MAVEFDPDIPNILLIEDDRADAILIREQFKAYVENANILSVEKISDAMGIYKKYPIDLILLDLNLPDGMGPRSVAEVRRFARKTPIVVLTGIAPDITIEEAKRQGANDVLQKTALVKDERFMNILKQYLPVIEPKTNKGR